MPLALAMLVAGAVTRVHWPAGAVMLIPLAGYWLLRLLQTGRAPAGIGDFIRAGNPVRYWGTLILIAGMLGVSISLAVVSARINLG